MFVLIVSFHHHLVIPRNKKGVGSFKSSFSSIYLSVCVDRFPTQAEQRSFSNQ